MVDKGEIYKMTSKTSGKSYIGQALKYVSGNMKWGSGKRFQSHIYEALHGKKDHCRALNNAIRKYGSADFSFVIIRDNVAIDDIDKAEIELIKEHDTLVPNGYNLTPGGSGKMGDEEKAQIKNMGKYIFRKKEFDKDLPLFLATRRREGIICGYKVYFPVPNGTNIIKEFKRIDVNDSYNAAIKYIEELKVIHNYEEWKDKVAVVLLKDTKNAPKENELTEEEKIAKYVEVKRERIKNKLPKNVYPIYTKNRMTGFYVEGILDHNKNPYPRKDFAELSCNVKNLAAAKRYIKELEIKNNDAVFIEYVPKDIKDGGLGADWKKNNKGTKNLPKYVAFIIVNNEKIGYQINNFPLHGDKIKKKFCDKRQTMEEKYILTLNFLRDLLKKKEQLNDQNNIQNNNDYDVNLNE